MSAVTAAAVDNTETHPARRVHWAQRIFWWLLAPLDSNKEGLSLTRLMAASGFCP